MKNQMLELGTMDCCAMREAFTNLEEMAHLKEAVGDEWKFKVLTEIFKRTARMSVPKNMFALFYYTVIKTELKRLNLLTQTIISLPCGHKVYEHIEALEDLKNQIVQLQRPNQGELL